MSRYTKAILATLAALATWGVTAAADGVYDQVELWGGLGALAAAWGVYNFPNTPPSGEAADPNISEVGPGADRGDATLTIVIAVIVVLVILMLLGVIG
jgi:hypothetical protein